MKEIMLCAISNIMSGNCPEDCAYCTQSSRTHADINKYQKKSIAKIIDEARAAKANHALGFCLVTSGKALNDKKVDYVCEAARAVAKEDLGLMLIACNGIASYEALKELAKNGVFSYNHNLETSKEFFNKICSTHSWEERFQTNLNAQKAGLALCCGGIYGLGESENDRKSFLNSLVELNPFSTPVNFFMKNDALNINSDPINADEALDIISKHKKALPNSRVLIAGGRQTALKDRQYEIFEHGADAVVIGDYLTAKGEVASKDIKELKKRGYKFAVLCH